jgi:hypothetical protein
MLIAARIAVFLVASAFATMTAVRVTEPVQATLVGTNVKSGTVMVLAPPLVTTVVDRAGAGVTVVSGIQLSVAKVKTFVAAVWLV